VGMHALRKEVDMNVENVTEIEKAMLCDAVMPAPDIHAIARKLCLTHDLLRDKTPSGNWTPTEYGFELKFDFGSILATRRPSYCNRGDYLVHLEWVPGQKYEFSVSEADFWPRYLFGETETKLQCEEWLRRHGVDPSTGKKI
jgi:hypothetical protein